MSKGNRIENWNADYAPHGSTYSEAPSTAGALNVQVRNGMVLADIRTYLPDTAHPKIAEVGCGGARTSVFLARRGYDVTCTDFAPEALRLAAANFGAGGVNGSLVLDDLMHSNLPPASFDCVMSFGLLEHFEHLAPVVTAVTRLVRPGGIQLHIVIPKKWSTQVVMDALWFPARLVKNLVATRDLDRIIERSYRQFPHFENCFSVDDYAHAFEAAGNQVLRREAAGTLYPFFALPAIGDRLARSAPHLIAGLVRRVDRSESRILHRLSPTFYLVCRRS